jgi:hypothetical protein
MRIASILALALVVTTALPAQSLVRHTIPAGFESANGGYGGVQVTPFGTSSPCIWQWAYPWSTFTHKFPITIFELSFRENNDTLIPNAVTYQGVEILLSSVPVGTTHTSVSPTFANNLDTDQTVVYFGDIVVPAGGGLSANPSPWSINVILQTPFSFDPTRRQDLVVQLRTTGATPAVPVPFAIDGAFPSGSVSQNGHVSDANSPVSNWYNENAGAVIELAYLFGSTNHFDLTTFTSGGGVGDLSVALTGIPMNTVRGYTLVSGQPVSIFGLEFGTGPVLGIYPDPITFEIISLPAQLGSPLHWLHPAPSGIFPTTPLFFPPGSLSSVTGSTWEVVAVGISGTGVLTGVTPVRSLSF